MNPFYIAFNSETYKDGDLPKLPEGVHYAIRNVHETLLKVNPEKV